MAPKRSRRNTAHLKHEGFVYRLKCTTRISKLYVCAVPRGPCPAKLTIKNGRVTATTDGHLHGPTTGEEDKELFKDVLWEELATTEKDPKEIYEEVATRPDWRNVAPRIPFPMIERSMQRWREGYRPPVPPTITQYDAYLRDERWKKYWAYEGGAFTSKSKVIDKETTVMIIGDPAFIASLGTVKVLHTDATFEVCPRIPKVYQLLTIMARVDDTAIPIAWALMTRKTTEAYVQVFKDFKQILAPNLNPQKVYADFEEGLKNAMVETYPGITVIHCYFHYCQAILRNVTKIGKKGMKKLYKWEAGKNFIRKLFALALLPERDILRAYEWLLSNTPKDVLSFFADLIVYYRRWWLNTITPSRFSAYRLRMRTNNAIEAYHRNLRVTMGKHPRIWPFTANLKTIQVRSIMDVESLNMGLPVRRQTPKKYINRNAVLFRLWTLYDDGRLSIPRFLACMNHISEAFLQDLLITTPDAVDQFMDCPAHNINVHPEKSHTKITLRETKKRMPIPIIRRRPKNMTVNILILEDIQQSLCTVCNEGLLNMQSYPCEHWFACENCTQIRVTQAFTAKMDIFCSFCMTKCTAFRIVQVS